jgi:hypothetical protein
MSQSVVTAQPGNKKRKRSRNITSDGRNKRPYSTASSEKVNQATSSYPEEFQVVPPELDLSCPSSASERRGSNSDSNRSIYVQESIQTPSSTVITGLNNYSANSSHDQMTLASPIEGRSVGSILVAEPLVTGKSGPTSKT